MGRMLRPDIGAADPHGATGRPPGAGRPRGGPRMCKIVRLPPAGRCHPRQRPSRRGTVAERSAGRQRNEGQVGDGGRRSLRREPGGNPRAGATGTLEEGWCTTLSFSCGFGGPGLAPGGHAFRSDGDDLASRCSVYDVPWSLQEKKPAPTVADTPLSCSPLETLLNIVNMCAILVHYRFPTRQPWYTAVTVHPSATGCPTTAYEHVTHDQPARAASRRGC